MIKKLFALLLCLLLTVMLPVGALAANNGKRLAISTPEELLRFAESCRLDSYSRGLEVVLTADLNLSGADFRGIPIFAGTFDGGGYTVSNFNIGDVVYDKFVGFFGYNYGTVTGCYNKGSVTGATSVGGVVGETSGTVSKCYNTGAVSCE